jgi:hypothetical protein
LTARDVDFPLVLINAFPEFTARQFGEGLLVGFLQIAIIAGQSQEPPEEDIKFGEKTRFVVRSNISEAKRLVLV